MIIKINNESHFPSGVEAMRREIGDYPNIVITDAVLTRRGLLDLIASAMRVVFASI